MNYHSPNPIEAAGRVERDGKALQFANFAACLMATKGDILHAAEVYADRYPNSRYIESIRKAAVSSGSVSDPVWAGPLAPMAALGEAFVSYLRPLTVLGRMSGFRAMPLNVKVPRATAGTSAGWVGPGSPAPVSAMGFATVSFGVSKIAGLCVTTKELARSSDPDSQRLIRDDLAEAVAQFSDQAFLDPTIAEVSGVSPASITYGAPVIASRGTTATALTDDLQDLLSQITTNFRAVYLVMSVSTALWICRLKNEGGIGDQFPQMGINGGSIWGIPVVVSDNMFQDTGNSPPTGVIAAIDASEVFLNDGGIELDATEQATIQMQTAPDSPITGATVMTSLFQNNLVATLARRYIRWGRRREGSVAILTGLPF